MVFYKKIINPVIGYGSTFNTALDFAVRNSSGTIDQKNALVEWLNNAPPYLDVLKNDDSGIDIFHKYLSEHRVLLNESVIHLLREYHNTRIYTFYDIMREQQLYNQGAYKYERVLLPQKSYENDHYNKYIISVVSTLRKIRSESTDESVCREIGTQIRTLEYSIAHPKELIRNIHTNRFYVGAHTHSDRLPNNYIVTVKISHFSLNGAAKPEYIVLLELPAGTVTTKIISNIDSLVYRELKQQQIQKNEQTYLLRYKNFNNQRLFNPDAEDLLDEGIKTNILSAGNLDKIE